MKYVDEFRDGALAAELAACICAEATRPLTLMEVCGTHTMAIARHGIRGLLPPQVRLISGPGCPVCVTPQTELDRFIALGAQSDIILASFGDMLRVPGSVTSLEAERARGADVRIVYSPLDAVALARAHPDRRVVFCGVGFETTAPAVALAIRDAQRAGLRNFFVFCAHKTVPPALHALAADPEVALDGLLCPGHVSTIIGSAAYAPLVQQYHLPCVIAGFEPLDILQAILLLVRQVVSGCLAVETAYARAVSVNGNLAARACLNEVFQPCDAEWRGLGVIPGSGLALRPAYAAFDATQFLPPAPATSQPTICQCGQVLRGRITPSACPVFATACTPTNPLGACMVSSEGACAAEYRYGRS